MQTQLRKNGTPRLIVVHRRPTLSAKIPAGRAPKNAPTAKKEPIHDSVIQKENHIRNQVISSVKLKIQIPRNSIIIVIKTPGDQVLSNILCNCLSIHRTINNLEISQ